MVLKYSPQQHFGGHTECFSIDILDYENNMNYSEEYDLLQSKLWAEENGLDFETTYYLN